MEAVAFVVRGFLGGWVLGWVCCVCWSLVLKPGGAGGMERRKSKTNPNTMLVVIHLLSVALVMRQLDQPFRNSTYFQQSLPKEAKRYETKKRFHR